MEKKAREGRRERKQKGKKGKKKIKCEFFYLKNLKKKKLNNKIKKDSFVAFKIFERSSYSCLTPPSKQF